MPRITPTFSPHDNQRHVATAAVRAGRDYNDSSSSVVTPIVQSTTFAQRSIGGESEHTYSRASNPTVAAIERALGALENAPAGVCFGTGMAAISTLAIALLRAGDEAIVSDVVYGGTVRLFSQVLEGLGVRAKFVDTSKPQAVLAAITPRTKLVLIESPANPTLKLTDVSAIAAITREHAIPLAVDNTFLTPVILRPLELGADISLYSTTKYVEGHNSTVGGAIVTRDERLLDRLRFVRKTLGTIQSPFQAWLTLQGLKTLPLRIVRHCQSALEIARFLESHSVISRVYYPGLESFPQAELANRQHISSLNGQRLHGGIVSFETVGGLAVASRAVESLRLCTLAENLGAPESLVTHPVSMTHGDVPEEQRRRVGITDGLIRLSVGLEEPSDIIDDLDRALKSAVDSDSDSTAETVYGPAEREVCRG